MNFQTSGFLMSLCFICLALCLPSDAHAAAQNDPFGGSSSTSDEDPFGDSKSNSDNPDNPFAENHRINSRTTQTAETQQAKAEKKDEIRKQGETLADRLNRTSKMAFDETDMISVAEYLERILRTDVLLDMSAYEDSLDMDTLVTFNSRHLKLGHAIRLMLHKHNATYMIDDGAMRIISIDVASDPEYFQRKIIDCRKLLEMIEVNESMYPSADRSPKPISKNKRQGGGVFNLPQDDEGKSAPKKPTTTEPAAEQTGEEPQAIVASEVLMETIKFSVTPDDWYDSNGNATLSTVGGLLVIFGNQQQIDEVQRFLDDLQSNFDKK